MTTDEAITILEDLSINTDKYGDIERHGWYIEIQTHTREALSMGSQALKQYGVLQEIRQEIENNMETIIGKYDASTPEHNRPSHKIERNNGRKECIEIIDKHIKEYTE